MAPRGSDVSIRAFRLSPGSLIAVAALLLSATASASERPAAAAAQSQASQPAVAGEDVLVNQPGVEEELQVSVPGEERPTAICNTQSEVSLARSGDAVVAAWNDGGECEQLYKRYAGMGPSEGISLSGYGFSRDGGRTWADGGVLDPPLGGHLFGDPVLSAAPDGTFFYATLVRFGSSPLQIGVARSTDGGESWSVPVIASQGRPDGAEHDKPWLAVDTTSSEHRGNVYVAWTEFDPGGSDCPGAMGIGCAVLVSRSTDGGLTFSPPVKVSLTPPSYSTERAGIGVQIAIGPEGQTYVAWVELHGSRYVWLATSLDGGVTFSLPREVADPESIGHSHNGCLPARKPGLEETVSAPESAIPVTRFVLNGDIRVFNWLSMAVDTSGSSDFRGTIYMAVPHDDDAAGVLTENLLNSHDPYGDESDIALIYSRDGGGTWSNVDTSKEHPEIQEPFEDGGTDTDQFHPQVAVDSEGRVMVSWYDRRVSANSIPENWEMALYAAVSHDGGKTFAPAFQVGDDVFPPSRTNPNTNWFSGCYMGEYNAMVGGEGEFLLAWGDNRDGPEAAPDPNVYFDRVTFGPSG